MKKVTVWLSRVKIEYFTWRGLWAINNVEGIMDRIIAAKLVVGKDRRMDLKREILERDALNNEQFRFNFLEQNRSWLLQHLVDLISLNHSDDHDLADYIRSVYSQLNDIEKGVEKTGKRLDISSDESSDEQIEKQKKWDRLPLKGKHLSIAHIWLKKARSRKVFFQSISTLLENKKLNYCSSCLKNEEMCSMLTVRLARNGQPYPYAIDELIEQFERENQSHQNKILNWRSFFRKSAEFITICGKCVDETNHPKFEKLIREPGTDQPTRLGDISSDDEESDEMFFEPFIIERTSNEGQMVQKWLAAARKKIGGTFPLPEAKKQMEKYLEKIKQNKRICRKKRNTEKKPALRSLVKLNNTAKGLVTYWLKDAKRNIKLQYLKKGEELNLQLQKSLEMMPEVDNWYFGQDFRTQGIELQKDMQSLKIKHANKQVELKKELTLINDEQMEFEQEEMAKLRRKQKDMEEFLADALNNAENKSELRIRELQKTLNDQEKVYTDKEGKFRKNDSTNDKLFYQIEISISEETRRLDKELKNIKKEQTILLSHEKSIIKRIISNNDKELLLRKSIRKDQITKEIQNDEIEWRTVTTGWVSAAVRKIERKQDTQMI